MNRPVHIVKFGSGILDDPIKREAALRQMQASAHNIILVHGGGERAGELSARLGLETVKHDGRRVTDADTLEVVVMVYAGLINKQLVAELQALGLDALGLSGADMDILRARRRPSQPIDFGFVGDVERVNAGALEMLLRRGVTPVICALTHDGAGQLLNTNADTIAAEIAAALAPQRPCCLSYCFELPGVLRDLHDAGSLIDELDATQYARLKQEGRIHRGMLPKLANAFAAHAAGVKSVNICAYEALHDALNGERVGTTIV